MSPVIYAITRAASSLPKGKLLGIFLLSILVNALALFGIISLIFWALSSVTWFGEWDWLADWGLTALASFIGYFIFPLLMPLIISFFDTTIADIIERDEYPEIPVAEPPFWPTIGQDVAFTLKAIGLNLLVLPLYLLPGVNIMLYYALNGYLLGSEFFNVVAGRHMEHKEAQALRRRHRLPVICCGAAIVFSATIPFLNLIAPIFGVALMVHYFHGLKPAYKAKPTPAMPQISEQR